MLLRFVDEDAGYLRWVHEHPDGCVLNTRRQPTRSFVVVHRASCPIISGDTPDEGWTTQMAKVCADSLTEISDWCRTQLGVYPSHCPQCSP